MSSSLRVCIQSLVTFNPKGSKGLDNPSPGDPTTIYRLPLWGLGLTFWECIKIA